VASPAAGRPKTHAQNHRVPYSLHAMLRNKSHLPILKDIRASFTRLHSRFLLTQDGQIELVHPELPTLEAPERGLFRFSRQT
jgi:hypothetical protein